MEMQDVDYELIYEPGDAADPLNYLSRHPLPETENDDTEKTVNMIVSNEHGVVMRSIKKSDIVRPCSSRHHENNEAKRMGKAQEQAKDKTVFSN